MAEGGTLASIIVRITADAAEFLEGMKKAETSAKEFVKVGAELSAVGGGMVTVLAAMAEHAGKFGAEIYGVQQKTGLAAEQISGLKLAAESTGSSLEVVEVGLKKLAQATEKAADGNKEASALFAKLGITAVDASGHAKQLNEVFVQSAEALSKITNTTDRAATAVALYGKGGMALLPIIAQGAEGLKKFEEKAKELGVSVTDLQAKQAKAFELAQEDAKKSFEGITMMAGQVLIPALTEVANTVGGLLVTFRQFAEGHQDLIKAAALLGVALLGAGGLALAFGAVAAAAGLVAAPIAIASAAIVGITVALAEFPKLRSAVIGVLHDLIEGATGLGSILASLGKGIYQLATGQFKQAWDTMRTSFTKMLDDAAAAGDGFDHTLNSIATAVNGGKAAFTGFASALGDNANGFTHVNEEGVKLRKELEALQHQLDEVNQRWNETLAKWSTEYSNETIKGGPFADDVKAGLKEAEAEVRRIIKAFEDLNRMEEKAGDDFIKNQEYWAKQLEDFRIKAPGSSKDVEDGEKAAEASAKKIISTYKKEYSTFEKEIEKSAGHIFDDIFMSKGKSVFASLGDYFKGVFESIMRTLFEKSVASLVSTLLGGGSAGGGGIMGAITGKGGGSSGGGGILGSIFKGIGGIFGGGKGGGQNADGTYSGDPGTIAGASGGGGFGGILGGVSSFMSGPWGAAVGIGVSVLGGLIGGLFKHQEINKSAAAIQSMNAQTLWFNTTSPFEMTMSKLNQTLSNLDSVSPGDVITQGIGAAKGVVTKAVNSALQADSTLRRQVGGTLLEGAT